MARDYRAPSRVLVIGSGIVGMSCAWSLQEFGVEVCVVDREQPGAGASWQNAGLVAPAMSVPLPEPRILRYGVRAVLSPRSPVALVRSADPRLARFMAGMVRSCTTSAWRRSMGVYRPLNMLANEAFAHQRACGVGLELHESDVVVCFARAHESAGFLQEMASVAAAGQPVEVTLLTADEVRSIDPHVADVVELGVRVRDQRYLTPSQYVVALAKSVRDRGGKIVEHTPIGSVERHHEVVLARGPHGDLEADAAVVAAGAWAGALLATHGVRVPVYGGRGYSFTVASPKPFVGPLYFPAARVAVTPQGDRARFAGIMEFGSPDAAPQRAHFGHMVEASRHLLIEVDWSTMADHWMGPRPLSADGVPLVGATATRGIYVAGGHGMWGVTLGPLTGSLLAKQITTGVTPPELLPLDPLR
ncbi:MAG: FAD-dependent oxidoreductase [Actinomycetota bacterium]|jgi:D-amino-acid dehydrogenase|nr:FAD-dependent oxidoreductase [Actinomycetota bacterium]